MSKVLDYEQGMDEIQQDIDERAEADAAFLDELIEDHIAMKNELEMFANAPGIIGEQVRAVLNGLNVKFKDKE